MAAGRILLVVLCTLAFSGARVFGSGIITFNKYNYERRNSAKRLIAIAKAEIGVRETGRNSGSRVRQYLAYVGFKDGVAWCAGFTSWCHGQAGYPQPRSAWCPALFPAGKVIKEPLPGCVFGIYFPSKGRIAHCGILEKMQGDFCVTLEGNTNVAGSREGDRIMRKLRHKRTIAKYADWL